MLAHGASDPLQTNSIRAIDGNRHQTLSADLLGIFWLSLHAMIAPRTERSRCCRDPGGAQTGTGTVRCGDGPGGTGSCARVVDRHFFFQAEDGIRDLTVTGVQTCALPI